jgi:hypothetical protein
MNYGETLSQAWAIIRRHKALWLFGFLAALGANSGYGYQFSPSNNQGPFGPGVQQAFSHISPEQWFLIVTVGGLVLLAAVAIVIILSTMGQIGLRKGTLQADAGAEALPVGRLWSDSVPYFWQMLLLNILVFVALILAIVILVMLGVAVAIVTLGIGLLCLIPLLCLLIPAGFLFTIWIELSRVALVADEVDAFEALRRGWDIVRHRLGAVFAMGLILVLITIVVSVVVGVPFAILVFMFAVAMGAGGKVATGGLVAGGLCLIILLPVLIVLASIVQAFMGASWTLTYLRLTRPGGVPALPAAAAPLAPLAPPPNMDAPLAPEAPPPPADMPPPAPIDVPPEPSTDLPPPPPSDLPDVPFAPPSDVAED